MTKHIQTWILITLLALFANGVVSAKLASGHQNLSGNLHQSQTVLKALLHQGLEEVSTMNVSGSPLATKGGRFQSGRTLGDRIRGQRGAIGESPPTLRRIHSDETLSSGSNRFSLDFHRGLSTDDIVRSLRPGADEALRIKPDGRIINGNTRIKVLEERGFDINSLPREVFD